MGSVYLHSLLKHFYLCIFCMGNVYLRIPNFVSNFTCVFLLDLFLKLMIYVWRILRV